MKTVDKTANFSKGEEIFKKYSIPALKIINDIIKKERWLNFLLAELQKQMREYTSVDVGFFCNSINKRLSLTLSKKTISETEIKKADKLIEKEVARITKSFFQ